MMIYDDIKREIKVEKLNEYILDENNKDKATLYKFIKLSKDDNENHYSLIVIDNIREYLDKFRKEEDKKDYLYRY